MATTNTGRKSGSRGRSGGGNSGNAQSGRRRSSGNSSARSEGNGNSGGFLAAVKARPLTSAAIAAGAAGAGAFIWAKRAQLSDQIGELTDAVTERFSSDEQDGGDIELSASRSARKGRGKGSLDETSEGLTQAGVVAY